MARANTRLPADSKPTMEPRRMSRAVEVKIRAEVFCSYDYGGNLNKTGKLMYTDVY